MIISDLTFIKIQNKIQETYKTFSVYFKNFKYQINSENALEFQIVKIW